MSDNSTDSPKPFKATAFVRPMSRPEIDQFLTVSPIGRLGMTTTDGPYVIPVGFCYAEGNIYIHMCSFAGRKMSVLKDHPVVCFEVDESLADASLAKSVIITGRAELIAEPKEMIPYLQMHIDKYRVPMPFGQYAVMNNRREKALKKYGRPELEILRICCITPHEITGRRLVRTVESFG